MAAAADACELYALACVDGKYYIGRVKNGTVEERFLEHCSGAGSEWTKKHEPLGIVEQGSGTVFDEDAWTLRYMAQYGVEQVRGGTYAQVALTNDQTTEIKRKLDGARDACFQCGGMDHFVAECPTSRAPPPQMVSRALVRAPRYVRQPPQCFRCGHTSHFVRDCFASWDVNGQRLAD